MGERVEAPKGTPAPAGAEKVELTRLPDRTLTRGERPVEDGTDREQIRVESDHYRSAAVGASKQPSYGKRTQLLPDGLQDPQVHLEEAKKLNHPFDDEHILKKDHLRSIEALTSQRAQLVKQRLELLETLKRRHHSLQEQQTRENQKASWTARRLGLKIQTALMRELQERYNIEDRKVPDLCLAGIGIIGPADESSFFEAFEVSPSVTPQEYHATKIQRSKEMAERVRRMAESSEEGLAAAIHQKTVKEVKAGTMGEPMSWDDLVHRYGDDFQVVPSFGLRQGFDEEGNPKFRRIDDHTASWNNRVARRLQKVPMTMVDYVAVLAKAASKAGLAPLLLATDDMKGAYRQVPLCPKHVRYSITAVYSTDHHEVRFHEMFGQPFGAGHAVPNFCRVAEWISRCLQRMFTMVVDHFFDDFMIVEPEWSIHSAVFCLQEAFKLLGFALDPQKSQAPAAIVAVLGVAINATVLESERRLLVEPKSSRVANLRDTILGVLRADHLSSQLAASIVGKFGFLCSTLFGKLGRCCAGAVRARQYSAWPQTSLTPCLRRSLRLMLLFLRFAPSREVPLHSQAPVLLYTDASDVPERDPRWLVGAVLYDPSDHQLLYSAATVPPPLVHTWLPRQNYMGQLELLAAPFALSTWPDRLRSRSIILFVDNDSAASNLVKGYSPQVDSAAIAGEFWLHASAIRANIYVDRVESKSNLSDGPSRNEFALLISMGGVWTDPCLDGLTRPTVDPSQWFGAPQRGAEEEPRASRAAGGER